MKRQKSYQRYRFNVLGCLTALVLILLLQPTIGVTQAENDGPETYTQ